MTKWRVRAILLFRSKAKKVVLAFGALRSLSEVSCGRDVE